MLDIHEYLMKKHDINYYLNLMKIFYWIIKRLQYSKLWWMVSLSFWRIYKQSLNNQPSEVRAILVSTSSNKPKYYPFVISADMYGGIVILLMIHILEYVFQINLKIRM